MQTLVVVESPAKAKTIEAYLGDSYSVIASFGHVRDMEDKDGAVVPGQWSDIKWSLSERGTTQVNQIVKLAKKSDRLILATDPDREGEAIAWHIHELLKEKGVIDSLEVNRAVFNSITKKAVTEAIDNMRQINQEKVEAYLARRILDYVVGFNISPLLWRRLPGSKSAGRVQSVALKLICERESEREAFLPEEYWTIEGNFRTEKDQLIKAKLDSIDSQKLKKFHIGNEGYAKEISKRVELSEFQIKEINKKPVKRNPKAPFITSTMQREASGKLGFSPEHTMRIAQTLYEQALITYMRTDSVTMSVEGIEEVRKTISLKYGEKYLCPETRSYKTKSKQAQEGHEAIRPTSLSKYPAELSLPGDEARLYRLIWSRAMASQMSNAELSQTEVLISAVEDQIMFKATGSQVVFPGFMEVYQDSTDKKEENEELLPSDLAALDHLNKEAINPDQHFTKPPARFSEASLIKELEEKGIGRPSTYASIMNSIKRRDYAVLENKQFIPAGKGRVVVSFLDTYFADYFKYDFTAEMEESLDQIAEGNLLWTGLLDKFWDGFEPNVSKVLDLSNRQVIDDLNAALNKELFPAGDICPLCESVLTLKNSPKYGPFIGCTSYDEKGCDYKRPTFLSKEAEEAHEKSKDAIGLNPETGKEIFIKPSRGGGFYLQSENQEGEAIRQTMPLEMVDIIELEDAIKWIQLPRPIGPHPDTGEMIEAGFARGPFVRVKRAGKETYQYSNIPKDENIFDVGMNRAVELLAGKGIQADEETELGIDPTSKLPVFMKVGRFGAYVETDELIRKTVPKDMQAEDVTLDWAISNLPIFSYFPNDSRPVGLRRQRTKAKGWKAFIAHAGNKAEVSNDIKVKDIDDAMANSILDDFYKKEEKKAKKKNKT